MTDNTLWLIIIALALLVAVLILIEKMWPKLYIFNDEIWTPKEFRSSMTYEQLEILKEEYLYRLEVEVNKADELQCQWFIQLLMSKIEVINSQQLMRVNQDIESI